MKKTTLLLLGLATLLPATQVNAEVLGTFHCPLSNVFKVPADAREWSSRPADPTEAHYGELYWQESDEITAWREHGTNFNPAEFLPVLHGNLFPSKNYSRDPYSILRKLDDFDNAGTGQGKPVGAATVKYTPDPKQLELYFSCQYGAPKDGITAGYMVIFRENPGYRIPGEPGDATRRPYKLKISGGVFELSQ